MSSSHTLIQAIVFDCYGVLDTDGLNDELVPLLKHLHSAYRLGILSNTNRASLDDFLERHHLRPLFDVVLASSQTRFVKPQREIFEIMAQRLDLEFHQILFIDDSLINTAAAERYGLSAITYRNPGQLESELKRHIQV